MKLEPQGVFDGKEYATRKDIRKSVFSFMEYLDTCPEKVLQHIGSLVMSEN